MTQTTDVIGSTVSDRSVQTDLSRLIFILFLSDTALSPVPLPVHLRGCKCGPYISGVIVILTPFVYGSLAFNFRR